MIIGRTRKNLCKLLQKEFLTLGDREVTWKSERIHAATGWYRSSRHYGNDSYRWEAFSFFTHSGNVAHAVGSYDTMTECVKSGKLSMHSDGEISAT